jgi:aldose 1-epimerase
VPPAPSGRQTTLVCGDQQAVVVEVGGGLRTYRAAGVEVLDGYAEAERCSSGRGQPLLPWPNRLDRGRYSFGAVTEQAPLTEPATGNAIHGLTRWSAWSLADAGTDHATTTTVLRPQPGWAWTLELAVGYRLGPDGLRMVVTATNRSATACPFGAGFHPYLLAPSGRVDDLELTVPASEHHLVDDRGIPTGTRPVDATPYDFRTADRIGDRVLDVALCGLARDDDGVATVSVRDPGTGRRVDVGLGAAWTHVMVFTGDTVGARARQGLAVEPMTGPANLLRSGDGLVTIAPEATWTGDWSLLPRWL